MKLSRYENYNEQIYRNQFEKEFDFIGFSE